MEPAKRWRSCTTHMAGRGCRACNANLLAPPAPPEEAASQRHLGEARGAQHRGHGGRVDQQRRQHKQGAPQPDLRRACGRWQEEAGEVGSIDGRARHACLAPRHQQSCSSSCARGCPGAPCTCAATRGARGTKCLSSVTTTCTMIRLIAPLRAAARGQVGACKVPLGAALPSSAEHSRAGRASAGSDSLPLAPPASLARRRWPRTPT